VAFSRRVSARVEKILKAMAENQILNFLEILLYEKFIQASLFTIEEAEHSTQR
jgi:hypothetical protein